MANESWLSRFGLASLRSDGARSSARALFPGETYSFIQLQNQPRMLEELLRGLSLFWQPSKHMTYKIKEELFIFPFKGKDRVRQVEVIGNQVFIQKLA